MQQSHHFVQKSRRTSYGCMRRQIAGMFPGIRGRYGLEDMGSGNGRFNHRQLGNHGYLANPMNSLRTPPGRFYVRMRNLA